jgi:hypothetical protein
MADQTDAAERWDAACATGESTVSWFEKHPGMSLQMLAAAGAPAADALIDVGGGASPLAGELLDRGFCDVTVLDISAAGMQRARDRLGPRAGHIHWLTADILQWRPERHYRAWHDRAVYHFLTTEGLQRRYLHALDAATAPGSIAVFGCFAPDGPPRCSGLPVGRYSPERLARRMGARWLLIGQGKSISSRRAASSPSPGSRCESSPESRRAATRASCCLTVPQARKSVSEQARSEPAA